MSEKQPQHGAEALTPQTEIETNQEVHVDKVEQAEKEQNKPENSVENLAKKVEAKAASTETHRQKGETKQPQHPALVNKQLKDMAYHRALARTRKHLSAPSRTFSKIVHSSALDHPSETIGKTVARPSSMLGGALFAMVGTSLLLWVTKKYGYEYNYLAVVVMFGFGMIVGLTVESLYKLIKKRR